MTSSSVLALLDQSIRLEAAIDDGRLIAPRLARRRTTGLIARLAGRPVAEIPGLLATLFPLCGTAHAVAGAMALEAVTGLQPPQEAIETRALMLLVEHATALGWRLAMDWPPLLGAPPATASYAAVRRAAAQIATAIQWSPQHPAATPKPDRPARDAAIADLCHALGALFPEALDPALSWSSLQGALTSGGSVPAQAIRLARAGAMAGYGSHGLPNLPPHDAAWFAARLDADPAFGDLPQCDGIAAEVGPLAAHRHPLVTEASTRWGNVLATRLLAAALDIHAVIARLRDTANREITSVETARGPLAYYAVVTDGRVTLLRSVAPTEWNFHPAGPFIAALTAAPKVPDPVQAARWLAASFDPCVPFQITQVAAHA